MLRLWKPAGFAVLTGLAALAAACSDTGPTATATDPVNGLPAANAARFALRLTDDPFPLDQVARADIYVVRVEGRLVVSDSADSAEAHDSAEAQDSAEDAAEHDSADAGGHGRDSSAVEHEDHDSAGHEHEDEGDDDHDGVWVTLAQPNASFNLLDFQNGQSVTLADTTLPNGDFREFRLILNTDSSSVTLTDGTVLTTTSHPGIKWPSAGETGIKIKLERPVHLAPGVTVVVMDFDLGRSFHVRGRSLAEGGLIFRPVIRASVVDETGSISGVVVRDSTTGDAVPGAMVELLDSGTVVDDTASVHVVGTGLSDSIGVFHFMTVAPGHYALRATPPSTLTGYNAVLLPLVAVTAGADAGGNVLVLPHQ